jgi:phosphate starvation-inducible protein PhoH and related proteins
MQRELTVEDSFSYAAICGPQDKNIRFLEGALNVDIRLNPNGFLVKGAKDKVAGALAILKKMDLLAKEGLALDEGELKRLAGSGPANILAASDSAVSDGIAVASSRKKYVFSKTAGQREYIEAMRKYDIVFSTGPAGTGKTYLAMAMAVNCLVNKSVGRIILTRPALEAGESLGFLPGDMNEKLGPYLRPLYDALYDMMEAEDIENYLETGVIEIAPIAYMRGRTLNNAFVILDEAQNCTPEQLRMFLTRLGFDSKTVITGDATQSDLPVGKPTGLLEAMEILRKIKGIKFIALHKTDVVRHPLIQNIIQAYENHYSKKTN